VREASSAQAFLRNEATEDGALPSVGEAWARAVEDGAGTRGSA
jgi:hypothetical protein